jgi:hypothetical protein
VNTVAVCLYEHCGGLSLVNMVTTTTVDLRDNGLQAG